MKRPGELGNGAVQAFELLRAHGLQTGEALLWLTITQLHDYTNGTALKTLAAAVLDTQAQPPDLESAQARLDGLAGFCMYASVESSSHRIPFALN